MVDVQQIIELILAIFCRHWQFSSIAAIAISMW
ncbi:Uncharacterized protein BM_BM4175 [Brugia malayi]|uniref:Uncharacterized protein n=1 Tax=Brugia malayi TaxID=6279 RepID=A0A5S6PM58_BRUMA|nr:Uncharacterized protein BM_BM4175 [Brugia malayi]VIO99766.1 Uncharacterized protein BM_BM4175 [Brugia malayi]